MAHFLSDPQAIRGGLMTLMAAGFAISASGFALHVWQRRNDGGR